MPFGPTIGWLSVPGNPVSQYHKREHKGNKSDQIDDKVRRRFVERKEEGNDNR